MNSAFRPQIGLRLLLLLVAIIAVSLAYVRAKMDLERETKEYKAILFAQTIDQMQHRRNEWVALVRDRKAWPGTDAIIDDFNKRIDARQKRLDLMTKDSK